MCYFVKARARGARRRLGAPDIASLDVMYDTLEAAVLLSKSEKENCGCVTRS